MTSRTRSFRILVTVGMLMLSIGAAAQDESQTELNQLELGLQLLSRGELRNGGMTSDPENPTSEDRSAFVLDRERLVVGYQRDFLEVKTTLQHVGTWGKE